MTGKLLLRDGENPVGLAGEQHFNNGLRLKAVTRQDEAESSLLIST